MAILTCIDRNAHLSLAGTGFIFKLNADRPHPRIRATDYRHTNTLTKIHVFMMLNITSKGMNFESKVEIASNKS